MSTHTETAAAASPAHEHEHGGTAVYAKTLIALLILTALTVIAAGFDFGQGNVVCMSDPVVYTKCTAIVLNRRTRVGASRSQISQIQVDHSHQLILS